MIVFCTTCKGRAEHIKLTLPQNLKDNPHARFVLLDYSSGDDLRPYLDESHRQDMEAGRLVVYRTEQEGPFRMAHAKNMAARCGILEGADVLVTLDADNFAGASEDFITGKMGKLGTFLCPDFPRIKSLPHGPLRPQRGYAGRLAIRSQDFLKMGGYDETFDTWRGEDIDLIARMQRTGFEMRVIPNHFLNAIPHNSEVRFKEYPHAQEFENSEEWKNIYRRSERVLNEGKIGCGMVWRNYTDPVFLGPVPTRIFGIGMHKTATSSLHEAFKILGYDSFHWETNRKAWDIWAEMNLLGESVTLERYYAACDVPIPMLYRELDRAYPGSKFILTVRSEESWLESARRLWNPFVNPHYDWHLQPFSNRLHEALYGRSDFDAETMLARFRRHNAEVRQYFRNRGDLLVMDMSQGAGWPELCGFLGKSIPSVGYPKKYVS